MEIQICWKPRLLPRRADRPRRFIGRIYTFGLSLSLFPLPLLLRFRSALPCRNSFFSVREDRAPVNESVQFRSSQSRACCSKLHGAANPEKFQGRKPACPNPPFPYDRLNRDNPGERSEHTSPVSGIITLFRSKPRYRSLARYSTQFLLDLPVDCFLSARSAYFLSAETYHRESFFLRRKQFRAVESIDRISNLPAYLPACLSLLRFSSPRRLKDFLANVTLLRFVAFTEHFILRTSTSLVFLSSFYTLFAARGKIRWVGQIARRSSKPGWAIHPASRRIRDAKSFPFVRKYVFGISFGNRPCLRPRLIVSGKTRSPAVKPSFVANANLSSWIMTSMLRIQNVLR